MCATDHRPSSAARCAWILYLALVLLQGCSTVPRPGTPPSTLRSAESAQKGSEVAVFALSMLDRNYRWGGKTLESGFDCSGLVRHVFRESIGVDLRGNAEAMAKTATPVGQQALQPGDLLFFNTLSRPSSHVGIYVGKGQFVHAANERSGVRINKLSDRYYAQRFEGAKTLLN